MRNIMMLIVGLGIALAFNFMKKKYTPKVPKSPIPVVYRVQNKKIPEKLLKFEILSVQDVEKLTTKTYSEYLHNLFESLMRNENIKAFDQDRMTQINDQMVVEGIKLQQLLKVGERGKDFAKENLQFFNDCTFEKKLLLSVRAICLFALQKTFEEIQTPFVRKNYPKQILKLSNVAKGMLSDY